MRKRIRKQPGFKLRQPRFLTADLASAQTARRTIEQRTTHDNRTEATHQRRRQIPTMKSPKSTTERRQQDKGRPQTDAADATKANSPKQVHDAGRRDD